MNSTAERLAEVRERITAAAARAGREPNAVRILAVAKTATPETLAEAWDAGQRDFAHNRVQRLEEHARLLPEAAWHVIGPLQSNKIRRALRWASTVQTIGDSKIALALANRATECRDSALPILLQVNLTPEDGRYGCTDADLPALLEDVGHHRSLTVAGLMTLGPHGADESTLHRHFAQLRELAEREASAGRLDRDFALSMGMTEDYEIAVEEGATLVRIGRAVFPPLEPTDRQP